MIIDEDIVAGGVTPFIITKLIERHERERQRYRLLHDYYMGDHRILSRRKRGKNVANNRIMCNHAKYITDMTQSYLVGNPVTYAVSDEYDIEAIKNEYLEQDMPSVDSEIVKNMSIYGKAYELIYADEKSKPRSVRTRSIHLYVTHSRHLKSRCLRCITTRNTTLTATAQAVFVVCMTSHLYIHTQVLTAIRHCHCKMLNRITFLMYLLSNTEIIRKCRAILNSL